MSSHNHWHPNDEAIVSCLWDVMTSTQTSCPFCAQTAAAMQPVPDHHACRMVCPLCGTSRITGSLCGRV